MCLRNGVQLLRSSVKLAWIRLPRTTVPWTVPCPINFHDLTQREQESFITKSNISTKIWREDLQSTGGLHQCICVARNSRLGGKWGVTWISDNASVITWWQQNPSDYARSTLRPIVDALFLKTAKMLLPLHWRKCVHKILRDFICLVAPCDVLRFVSCNGERQCIVLHAT
jgi:hypothetical protein